MSARHRSYLLLVLVSAIWGIATPVIKVAFGDFPPDIFLTYRFFITSLLLVPLLFIVEPRTWRHLSHLTPREWTFLLLSGFLGSTVQLGLVFWGLDLTTALDAAVIGAMSPVFVALACHYFLNEPLSRRTRIGLFIAFSGSILVVIQPVFAGTHLFSGNIIGNFLVLLGVFTWTGYILLTKQELRENISPLLLTTDMFFTGFVSMTVITLLRHQPWQLSSVFFSASLYGHLSVFYMAFISGAFAYWAYQKGQKSIPASKADIFMYLSPLFTLPLAFWWLHDPVTLFFLAGCLIITVGVVISQLSS